MQNIALLRTVANLMSRFGGNSTLQVVTEGEYDPATSSAATYNTPYTVQTLVFDYLQKLNGTGIEGSLVKSGDKQVFMMPATGVPLPRAKKDFLVINGENFSIVTVKDLNPSGSQSFVYEIYIRQ